MRELIYSEGVFASETKQGRVIVEIKGKLNALLGEKAYPNCLRAQRRYFPQIVRRCDGSGGGT